ncbi:increased rDNA silencing protein 4 [Neurospora crassa]|uniref:Increased rDNA silencing protein 4 n=1 Tax=Neurospora crassa (strain ATCC 24698 / 74-OR23-1A / CBS 708.71 / DSM 1257 / FGSC 987) TaxID=367110 RepID=IRS4_NEUCR|nr:hypothetical protein NCU06276 [Neurospora crassa OR74A]Q7SB65.1 RecName: Full=Increased rDNA silencing protein 4 [Neurospora crassa OR74A]EAA33644.1 hypothetical protein NCU06276 [Neurospora crassa OR74A]KHE84292.1 increased rDNA silencing protein 4 [Neurospora crassa]|eukprot:XP_962880.1 hypothetical protein NCU06276 [Neurospora crassa OR74A]
MSASVTSSDGRGPASPTSSSTGASTNPATSGLAAALKGATLAFQHQQRTAAKGSDTAVPRPHGGSRVPTPGTGSVSTSTSRTVGGSNGARLAATLAAREHSPPTTSKNEASRVVTSTPSSSSSVGSAGRTNRQELHGQATGGSSQQQQQQQHVEERANDHAPSKRPAMRSRRPSLASLSSQAVDNSHSHPPTPASAKPSSEPKSVSWIAATLAATSIAPTTSLVAMFDGKQEEAETATKKKKKKKPRPASKTQHHQTLTSPSPTPSEGLSIENQCGTGGVPSVASGKSKVAPKPKPKPRRDISLSTVESIKSSTGAMGRDGKSSNQEQGETRNRNGDVRDKPSREGGKVTVTGAKDIVFEGTSERRSQQKVPATPRSVQSKQGVEVPTDKRPSTPPVSQHAQISETTIISPQPRRVVSTPRLESSPAVPKTYKTVTNPRPDNKPTIRKSSRVVSPSVDQSQTIRQSAETGLGDRHTSRNSTSSDETFVSASSSPSPRPQTPTKELERVRPRLDRANTSTSSRASRVSTPASVRSPASQTRPSPVLRPGTGLYSYSTGASPTPEMSLDSLTNAMIASNLASSRLTALTQTSLESPGLPPVPPPRRGHRHHHLPHPHLRHRTQSPPHARPLIPQRTADSLPVRTGPSRQTEHTQPASLLKTLRAPRSLSDDEDLRLQTHRHRKKHLGGKKHAHNEGARRRWRDEMTIRQRRRYEAVWASNRGLFLRPGFAFEHPENWQPLPPPDDSLGQVDLSRAWESPEADLVVNVVVRDIWSRSRLPVDELAEVWELVDRRKCGALDKQEFVVGMWLIDQRLRGRKIPTVVGEGVWESAMDRVLSVNVKAPKAHKGRTKGHLKGVF